MKVKVPNKIKIATHPYTIRYKDHLKIDENFLGSTNTRTQAIEIEPTQALSEKNMVLFHEVIHIINNIYGCDLDERNISRLSQGMAEFLANNLGIEFDWSNIKKL